MSARTGEKLLIRLENAITAGENRLYPSAEAYRADMRAIAAQIAEHDRRQRGEIQRLHRELESAGAITPDELAERYMELPVDADGVPVRVGDTLEHVPGGWAFTADTMEIDRWGVHVRPNGQSRIPCGCCRHVKPRTVEDVLRDMVRLAEDTSNGRLDDGDIEGYADEIRELIGGAE